MEPATFQPTMYNPGIQHKSELSSDFIVPHQPIRDAGDIAFEIGLWLSGLESFLRDWDHIPRDNQLLLELSEDWTKEFRLTHSALLICSDLNYQLRKSLNGSDSVGGPAGLRSSSDTNWTGLPDTLSVENCDEFLLILRDIITLNSNFIKAGSLSFDVWKAWKTLLAERLRDSETVQEFTAYANRDGYEYLPADLRILFENKQLSFSDRTDLYAVMSRFAIIIRSLTVVGTMLRNDDPLKSTVIIFAKVYERSQELIDLINSRLSRFNDEGAELFASLDSASYTATLELKKVYQQELVGLVGIRPAPSIHAKVETAYSLINDSFEQILAGFARLIEPGIVVTELFPSIQLKLEQSLSLRSQLWKVLHAVKAAEQNPEKRLLDDLKKRLTSFLDEPIGFLYFKDKETLERFSEEIVAASGNKDIVPILHRFGAYLETLFSLVNMRTVLGAHPFAEPKR